MSHSRFDFTLISLTIGILVALSGCGSSQRGETRSTSQRIGEEVAHGFPSPPAMSPDFETEPLPKVAFDLYIMSKCPFAGKLLQNLIPVMTRLGNRVDLTIHYIGRDSDGKLTSMHGDEEVQGDILQLCASDLGGTGGMLAFIGCQLREETAWEKIPEGWEACATLAGLEIPAMQQCLEGGRGTSLLRASFLAAKEQGATGSPTIYIAGAPYKGGRSEISLSRHLCRMMTEPWDPYCSQIPPPIPVPVTIVSDRRCTQKGCDPERFIHFLEVTFEGARIAELDYATPEGKALYERAGLPHLPIAVFGPDVVKEEHGYSRLQKRLAQMPGSYEWVYPLGRSWDPTAEVCDDGIDNTGNGQVDCRDDDCKEKRLCRKEKKGRLELFLMSQCPYAMGVVEHMMTVLEDYDRNRQNIDFSLSYIGINENGELSSMHGQSEVDEDIRQLCAQKHYPKRYKFMDYVACRAKDYQNEDWQACAVNGIKAEVIAKCAEGEEGKELLDASFSKSKILEITGSPTWLLNNRHKMSGRDPESIKKGYCERNSLLDVCHRAERSTGKRQDTELKATPGTAFEGS